MSTHLDEPTVDEREALWTHFLARWPLERLSEMTLQQYNQAGEKKGGPAPRGMDRFAVEVVGGQIVVNTGLIVPGPAIGTNTTGQEAEGPHCVGSGGGH